MEWRNKNKISLLMLCIEEPVPKVEEVKKDDNQQEDKEKKKEEGRVFECLFTLTNEIVDTSKPCNPRLP